MGSERKRDAFGVPYNEESVPWDQKAEPTPIANIRQMVATLQASMFQPIEEEPLPQVNEDLILRGTMLLLEGIGCLDRDGTPREGMEDTPQRVVRMWKEFIEYDPGTLDTAFESVTADQIVLVSGMRVWSFCEHHLLPFWCDVSIAYIPVGQVLGLSKLARIAHKFAHQPQIQERLSNQIADCVQELSGSPDVAVICAGEHLCMTMRGIRTPALMQSSITRGAFREDPSTRAELFALLNRGR